MEGKSLSQAAKSAGVPKTTLHRWKEKGKLMPDVADDKGEITLYSEAQIELARELYNKRTDAKAECTCAGGNDDSDDAQAVEVVDEREDDGSNDDDALIDTPADNGDALNDTPNAANNDDRKETADKGDLTESVTTPAQIVTREVNSAATIETSAEIITLNVRANRIRQLQADVQRGIIEIGFELIAAKKEIGHGNWGRWLQKEFEWTERTARNFMAMAERFGNRKTFSDLRPSTLQALLALPEGEEDKFIAAQAEAGEPVGEMTTREVKSAIKKFKAENKPVNPFSFEGKHARAEVKGEYLRVLPNAPTIEDVQNSDALETSEAQDSRKKKLPPIAHNSNGSVNYFTPSHIIDAARAVLGEIDLDPASCELANQTVKAAKFFTADDDGLNHEWRGRIWLNPPFAKGLIDKFVDKLSAEIDSGNVTSAIVLVDNATETGWFRKLVDKCANMVFTTGRINFLKEGTMEAGSPTRGQAFLYFGGDAEKFFSVFKQFGWAALFTKSVE